MFSWLEVDPNPGVCLVLLFIIAYLPLFFLSQVPERLVDSKKMTYLGQ